MCIYIYTYIQYTDSHTYYFVYIYIYKLSQTPKKHIRVKPILNLLPRWSEQTAARAPFPWACQARSAMTGDHRDFRGKCWWFVAGGLEPVFFHILGIILPTDFHIFQRGSQSTNQWCHVEKWWFHSFERGGYVFFMRCIVSQLNDPSSIYHTFFHGSSLWWT